ncbi:MAG: prephenate dehydrogenase [Planctomycetes bacterium]|nr:prephenate dehydrogenase [Planctomycetota bacterium]
MANKKSTKPGVVCIIGPGMIGGSVGLGLRKKRLAGQVIGVGHRRASLTKALKMGAIDTATLDLEEGVREADIVIICTSVELIPEMAAKAIPAMKRGSVLTDVGSAKRGIVEFVERARRNDIAFVGGHPIAGSERRGIDAAKADLFVGSVCILTPVNRRRGEKALRRVKAMWQGLGAKVHLLSPAEHDRTLASTSHLPLLLASALVNTVGAKKLPYAGPGFRDMTRIASSDAGLWRDILLQNRREVIQALKSFKKELDALESAIDGKKAAALHSRLKRAKRLRDSITRDRK